MRDDGQIKPSTVIVSAAGALITLLIGLVSWFAVHTITGLCDQITKLSAQYEATKDVVWSLRQEIALLKVSFESHSKACKSFKLEN